MLWSSFWLGQITAAHNVCARPPRAARSKAPAAQIARSSNFSTAPVWHIWQVPSTLPTHRAARCTGCATPLDATQRVWTPKLLSYVSSRERTAEEKVSEKINQKHYWRAISVECLGALSSTCFQTSTLYYRSSVIESAGGFAPDERCSANHLSPSRSPKVGFGTILIVCRSVRLNHWLLTGTSKDWLVFVA